MENNKFSNPKTMLGLSRLEVEVEVEVGVNVNELKF